MIVHERVVPHTIIMTKKMEWTVIIKRDGIVVPPRTITPFIPTAVIPHAAAPEDPAAGREHDPETNLVIIDDNQVFTIHIVIVITIV
jgi:hypothetical protein